MLSMSTIQSQPRTEILNFDGPITTSTAPPNLHTLHEDILPLIFSHLDTSSALSLLKVAKAFVSPAESTIWREIDFAIPYLSAPYLNFPDEGVIETEEDELRETEWRVAAGKQDRMRLRRRYQRMIDEANPRRWKMIKVIEAVMTEAINDLLISVLERVSPTLEYLHLEQLGGIIKGGGFDKSLLRLNSRLKLCGSQVSFSSLTFLILGENTFEDISFIHFICEACPKLETLSFSFLSRDPPESDPDEPTPSPPKYFTKSTLIRHLRIAYDYEDDGPQVTDNEAICELLTHCPKLHRLELPVGIPQHDFHARAFLPFLKEMTELRFIIWGGTGMEIGGMWKDQATIDMVEYVRMSHYDLSYPIPDFSVADPFSAAIQRLPRISNLVALSFDCSLRNFDPSAYARSDLEALLTFVPSTTEVLPIAPDTAEWMKNNHQLHSVYIEDKDNIVDQPTLDAISKCEPAAIFTSMQHGASDELLHARVLVNDIAVQRYDTLEHLTYWRILHTRCDALIGQIAGIVEISPPVFHDFTYYEGDIVPMEVIREMQKAEGITDMAYWDRRGIQVGEVAWDVIRSWRERVAAEVEKETAYGNDLCAQFLRF